MLVQPAVSKFEIKQENVCVFRYFSEIVTFPISALTPYLPFVKLILNKEPAPGIVPVRREKGHNHEKSADFRRRMGRT